MELHMPTIKVASGWIMLSGTPNHKERWDTTGRHGTTGDLIRDYQALHYNQSLQRANRTYRDRPADLPQDPTEKRMMAAEIMKYQGILHQLRNNPRPLYRARPEAP